MELDDADIKILNELIKDSRASLRDIARRVGLSAPAVRKRLNRLTDAAVIKGYTAIINRDVVDAGVASIALIRVSPGAVTSFRERASASGSFYAVYETAGHYNFVLFLEAENQGDLARKLEALQAAGGVEEVETLIITKRAKEDFQRPLSRATVNLKCELCGSTIKGRPYELKYKGVTLFFCCPTCRKAFRERYMS